MRFNTLEEFNAASEVVLQAERNVVNEVEQVELIGARLALVDDFNDSVSATKETERFKWFDAAPAVEAHIEKLKAFMEAYPMVENLAYRDFNGLMAVPAARVVIGNATVYVRDFKNSLVAVG